MRIRTCLPIGFLAASALLVPASANATECKGGRLGSIYAGMVAKITEASVGAIGPANAPVTFKMGATSQKFQLRRAFVQLWTAPDISNTSNFVATLAMQDLSGTTATVSGSFVPSAIGRPPGTYWVRFSVINEYTFDCTERSARDRAWTDAWVAITLP